MTNNNVIQFITLFILDLLHLLHKIKQITQNKPKAKFKPVTEVIFFNSDAIQKWIIEQHIDDAGRQDLAHKIGKDVAI